MPTRAREVMQYLKLTEYTHLGVVETVLIGEGKAKLKAFGFKIFNTGTKEIHLLFKEASTHHCLGLS